MSSRNKSKRIKLAAYGFIFYGRQIQSIIYKIEGYQKIGEEISSKHGQLIVCTGRYHSTYNLSTPGRCGHLPGTNF